MLSSARISGLCNWNGAPRFRDTHFVRPQRGAQNRGPREGESRASSGRQSQLSPSRSVADLDAGVVYAETGISGDVKAIGRVALD
jgi:hypothetical protein